jgi:hypothetical protein
VHGWPSGRQARSISYRIGGAKFPVLKDLDTFVFADTPIDEGQLRELATAPSPTPSAMRCLSAAREPAKPIFTCPHPRQGGASSTWSTWSISWTPQKPVQDFADIEASGLGRWAKSFEALLWRAPARKH